MIGASLPAELPVALPTGPATIPLLVDAPSRPPRAVLALAHGAGAGKDHPFLAGLAAALAVLDVVVVRFDFPYVAAGRRMPGPAAHAIATWAAVLAAIDTAMEDAETDAGGPGRLPVLAAGKSYGGRMASMAAADGAIAPAGLVYLGYPLHPPGRPDKPRVAHLPQITAPQLFVEGTSDPFIQPREQLDEAVASCQNAETAWIDGGGHSFEVKGARQPPDVVGAGLAPTIDGWLRRRILD